MSLLVKVLIDPIIKEGPHWFYTSKAKRPVSVSASVSISACLSLYVSLSLSLSQYRYTHVVLLRPPVCEVTSAEL